MWCLPKGSNSCLTASVLSPMCGPPSFRTCLVPVASPPCPWTRPDLDPDLTRPGPGPVGSHRRICLRRSWPGSRSRRASHRRLRRTTSATTRTWTNARSSSRSSSLQRTGIPKRPSTLTSPLRSTRGTSSSCSTLSSPASSRRTLGPRGCPLVRSSLPDGIFIGAPRHVRSFRTRSLI